MKRRQKTTNRGNENSPSYQPTINPWEPVIRSNFIKTTYDISLDSQISFLPLGFSPLIRQLTGKWEREWELIFGLLEGRTLTRESNSEFTPRVSKLPTFPLLGFSRNNRQAQVLFRNQVREMLDVFFFSLVSRIACELSMKFPEKIPWEGEFTLRSDSWAGLIASWGSF